MSADAAEAVRSADRAVTVAIEVTDRAGAVRRFSAAPGERLLHAGLCAGVGLPHECATGTCGMCKATLRDGDVADLWADAPGRKTCRRRGEMLLCQSAARSDAAFALKATIDRDPDPPCVRRTGCLTVTGRPTPEVLTLDCILDRPLAYEAGQFALIELPGIEGPRAWSMTTHAPEGATLTFLVRKLQDGAASNRLFGADDEIEVGVLGPFGRAIYPPSAGRNIVAIAGGSGIAGILAILDRFEREGAKDGAHAAVYFGLRDPASAYFLGTLDALSARCGGAVSVCVAFSHAPADPGIVAVHPHLRFREGLVHEVAAADLGQSAVAPLHYVAGPPAMVNAALKTLIGPLGVDPGDIRYDRFG